MTTFVIPWGLGFAVAAFAFTGAPGSAMAFGIVSFGGACLYAWVDA
jgi:hypothetical protein